MTNPLSDEMPETREDAAPDAPEGAAAPPAASPAPPAAPASHRELQKRALRDLVALATESAATEAAIEAEHQAAIEEAAKENRALTWQAEERHRNARDAARRKYADRVAQITAQFDAEFNELRAADKQARARIDAEVKAVERDVKKKFEQAAWLAESVADGSIAGAHEDFKKAKEENEADVAYLEDREAETAGLLERYRYAPPPPAPAAEPAEDEAKSAEAQAQPTVEEATEAFKAQREAVEAGLTRLHGLPVPKLFSGPWPFVLPLLLTVGAGAIAQGMSGQTTPQVNRIAIAAGSTLGGVLVLGFLLRLWANAQIRRVFAVLRKDLDAAHDGAAAKLRAAAKRRDDTIAEAERKRDEEIRAAKERLSPLVTAAHRKRDAALAAAQADYNARLPVIEAKRDKLRAEADAYLKAKTDEADARLQADRKAIEQRLARRHADAKARYEKARAELERRLQEGLATARSPIARRDDSDGPILTWTDPAWRTWVPPRTFPAGVRFGHLDVDLRQAAVQVEEPAQRNKFAEEFAGERSARGVTSLSRPGGGIGDDDDALDGNGGEGKGNGAPLPSVRLPLPEPFEVPLDLAFPRQASVLLQADRAGRPAGIAALQMIMARLLTSLPAGRARFTIFDPVGLGQNFAGFMHLADHDDALVGGRIWTEREQIEQRLADLTEHMETVIQKYLRNEYETIDDYNAQAGELAEPYRFLVIADFPAAFEGESFNRLASIVNSGARCGIHTLILRDTRQPLPAGTLLDELEAHSVNLVYDNARERFVWKDDVFKQFPLTLDPPPSDEFLTGILDVVGRAAKENARVELPFETITPRYESEMWSLSSAEELRVPVGRMGATRLQHLKLGKGVAQHVLIAGKTGSGKSTLLNAIITNLAMWYSPEEVEVYLIDFKKGVEFKTYATHNLPHARAIAIESDREFGLSVLQRLDAELTRRGNLFRKLGVQDLPSYRQVTAPAPLAGEGRGEGEPAAGGAAGAPSDAEYPILPRTLLIIDEFQEFFSEDDKLAQDAGLLLDRLVRQGRAFGIHVLLGSQTIGGSSGLARSTIGQMAVRVALQTSEADSQLILGDGNSAARLLSRPGEAIYNDAGGAVEGNSPFQVAWLPDDARERFLERVQAHIASGRAKPSPFLDARPIVFEGNAAADVRVNAALTEMLDGPRPDAVPNVVHLFVGDPVAIKEPTEVTFRRQSGANVLLVGQQEEQALAILVTAMISAAVQHPRDKARFVVLDGSPADSPLARVLPSLPDVVPHDVQLVEYRAVDAAIHELAEELQRRQAGDDPHPPSIYLVIYGLQRYRVLRKSEDSYSFSMSEEEKKPQPDKEFLDILREGPGLGIHVLTWCDTPASVERTIDRTAMREFDHRILFQMSAADSSNLIDSPLANKLGFHRALVYSEEQGLLEKFRPYALPPADFLDRVRQALKRG